MRFSLKVDELPDTARQPLTTALALQALASHSKNLGHKSAAAERVAALAARYTGAVDAARAEGLLGDDSPRELAGGVDELEKAATLLWGVGLAQLQLALATGQWTPPEIDLRALPKEDPLVSGDHTRRGKKTGGFGFQPA